MALNTADGFIEKQAAQPGHKPGWVLHINGLSVAGAIATIACAAPALAVLVLSLGAESADFAGALLRDGATGTAALMLVGGGGAIALGAASAWLISLCDFPTRRMSSWLLVVPMAAPSYVLAYAYSGMTWAGASPIVVEGFWGAAFIYAFGLYPYVYLAARAAFVSQSSCALEAARALGASPNAVFWRVALPLARPGIAAGGALAMMEIAADYGGAQHFGLTTLTTAVFRAWYAHANLGAALQISAVLLIGALLFLVLERRARGRAQFAGGSTRWRPLPRYRLQGFAAICASAFCITLVSLGALLPLAWLGRLALLNGRLGEIVSPLVNSLALAGMGTIAALACAAAVAVAAHHAKGLAKYSLYAASVGYAAPGAVIAIGALAIFAFAREAGWVGGLSAGLALTALIWTYAARFAAAGLQPIDAGLKRLAGGLDASARTLGAGPWRRFWRIDLPIAAPSLAAAALIIFVEILKELPATLILRPFNFDTLAVVANAYASDERLLQAAAPSLLIFLAGLVPILLLTRSLSRARPGTR
jgi:iron(III) transport system permease protein